MKILYMKFNVAVGLNTLFNSALQLGHVILVSLKETSLLNPIASTI